MLERILLAVDASEHARKAVPATIELARVGGGTVRVLHAREVHHPLPPTVVGDSPKEAQAFVDGVVADLQQAGVTCEGAVRPTVSASPAGTILQEARDADAGMIVLGSRGLSDLGDLLLGSVAHKVIQLSTCPVLAVRDEQSLQERHHDVLRAQTRFQS
jgi:nucleotide-binding universal stress UspA family protein